MTTRLLLTLALLLTGCVPALRTYTNGPATVVLGDDAGVRAYCTAAMKRSARGCLRWWHDGRVVLACPWDDGECWAHELRHAVDRDWRHE